MELLEIVKVKELGYDVNRFTIWLVDLPQWVYILLLILIKNKLYSKENYW